jgi:hypothetical protein
MTIEIKTTYFVKPRAAFQIVGQESFGVSWQPEAIDDTESELRRIALANLRAALESGHVRAFLYDFRDEYPLDLREAAGEFFRINLDRDCVHLADGVPVECKIHSEDLVRFVREEGKPGKLTIGAQTACREWLVRRFSEGRGVPKREFLWAEAKVQFPGLSRAAFDRARAEAADDLGLEQLKSAGRPRTVEN